MPPENPALNLTSWCLRPWAEDPTHAARPAFTFVTAARSQTWAYAEAWARCRRVAESMIAAGVRKGDRVLIRLPHSPEYAFAFFGATLAGALPIPASPALTAPEAAFLASDSGARVMVSDGSLPIEAFEGLHLRVDSPGQPAAIAGGLLPPTFAEDPAFLIYTSGTTSHPKGVIHAHRSVYGRAMMREGWQDFRETDTTLHAGTLNWSYTLGVGLMDSWAAGAHAVLYGGPADPRVWPGLIERLGITVFAAVPTVYRQVLKYGAPEEHDLSSLRHVLCAGEPLPPALLEEWRRRIGTEMYEALGMTEVSTYISSSPSAPIRPGSPGKPQNGRRVAILPRDSESTEALAPGEVGMLAVHRSDPGLMLGYWNRPEEERQVFRGDWFVGGDLASLDEDGYLWFQGRADDVIKSFGYRLSPVEIEAQLATCPGVSEVAVVAVHIADQKDLVVAAVVPVPGAEPTRDTLNAHATAGLAEYKRPHEFLLVERMPRTPNGKLQRKELAAQLRERLLPPRT